MTFSFRPANGPAARRQPEVTNMRLAPPASDRHARGFPPA
jgi:hypothetical protein